MGIKRLSAFVAGLCLTASLAFAQSAPTDVMNYGAGGASTGSGSCTGAFCAASAPLAANIGGTGLDNSASTGVPLWTAGTQSILSTTGTGNVVRSASPTLTGTITGAALTLSGTLTTNLTGGGTLCVHTSNTGVLSAAAADCGSGGGGITIASTTITSGTTTRVLFDNAGVVGEYSISGTGNVAMTTSPTFVTPVLGTITSGNLAAGTGYALANLTGAGTGVLTLLGTYSSANARAAYTDETGTGAAFFAGGNAGIFSGASLALGGCTIGTDVLCLTGTGTFGGAITLGVAGSVVGAINVANGTSGAINVSPPTGALGTPSLVWPDFSGTLALSGGVNVMTADQTPNAATWATFPTYVVNAASKNITLPLSTTLNSNSGIAVSAMNAVTIPIDLSDQWCNPTCGSAGVSGVINANQLVYINTDGNHHFYATQVSAAGGGLTIGTSTITSGTNGRVLYDNSGVVGEMTTTGSGTVLALATSPTFVTPTLGVATATTYNKITITAPATGATLTIPDGTTLNTGAGGTLGSAAFVATGTSGGTVGLLNGDWTHSGRYTNSKAGAASAPGVLLSGTIFTGGSGTTTFPYLFIQPAGTTAATDWNTSGTALGINMPNTSADAINIESVGGGSIFKVDGFGKMVGIGDLDAGAFSSFCFGVSTFGCMKASSADLRFDFFGADKSTYAQLRYAASIISGATPTLTGTCTTGTKTGGQTGGTFVATCTAQTVIITFAITAPTGWDCSAQDRTTPADTLKQISSTTTSCTLSGTTVASDVIGWHSLAYLINPESVGFPANDNRKSAASNY